MDNLNFEFSFNFNFNLINIFWFYQKFVTSDSLKTQHLLCSKIIPHLLLLYFNFYFIIYLHSDCEQNILMI